MQSQRVSPKALHALKAARRFALANDHERALEWVEKALRLKALVPQSLQLKALALKAMSRIRDAYAVTQEAIARFPDNAALRDLHCDLAMLVSDLPAAHALLLKRTEADRTDANAFARLCCVQYLMGDLSSAAQTAREALAIDESNSAAHTNLANAIRYLEDPIAAIPHYRKALLVNPRDPVSRSNLLLALLSDPAMSASELAAEARTAARMLSRDAEDRLHTARLEGRVRIGFLSADIRRHPVSYFLIPLLANLNRDRFECIVFMLNTETDAVSQRIAQYADRLEDLSAKPHDDVTNALRKAQLDVLIELGGYTGLSPLQYLSPRVAPVQMTWLGYPGSTGMPTIDYRITDENGDPGSFDAHYSETLLRAPAFCAYHPHVPNPLRIYSDAYRVRPTPAIENGYITFGSCAATTKITSATLDLWARVLHRCPNAVLLLEVSGLEDAGVESSMRKRLEAAGISNNRFVLLARKPENQYLTYHRIDIVLDTVPFTGGTTTCDALWMGVPVVTLTGEAFHRRMSSAVVAAAGCDDLICDSESAYIEKAVALASDVGALEAIRQGMRQRFEQGAISDAGGFARWLENTLANIVSSKRAIPAAQTTTEQSIFFNGQKHGMRELLLWLATLLQEEQTQAAHVLLEHMTNAWHRHWAVAYGLARLAQLRGDYEEAINLLIESISMRPYSVSLYRLLAGWMNASGFDRNALEAHLAETFGLQLSYLDSQAMPNNYEVMGFESLEVAA